MEVWSKCVSRAKELQTFLQEAKSMNEYKCLGKCNHFNFRISVPKNANNISELSCSVPIDDNSFHPDNLTIEVAAFDSTGQMINEIEIEYCTTNLEVEKAILKLITMKKVDLVDYEE